MEKKHVVVNKHGHKIRLNDAALALAEKHFGVNKARPGLKEVPIELLKLPKRIDLIKAEVKVVKPVVEVVVEPVVIVPEVKEVPTVAEVKVVKERKTKK